MADASHKTDISHRVKLIFQHPKQTNDKGEPIIVAVSFPWLMSNGHPHTEKGMPWIYQSVELIH